MDHTAFAQACRKDGYDDVEEKQGMPGFSSKMHTHPFSVRISVLSGEFTIDRNGGSEVYGAGDSFSVESGREHAESFGPQGATFLVARKRDTSAA